MSRHSNSNPFDQASTIAVTGIAGPEKRMGALVGALVQSTTYAQDRVGEWTGPTYSRVANPSVDELETVLGALEDAPPSVCFGTGLAAETALFLALLKSGDHAVVGEAIYGGTVRLFRTVLKDLGIESTFVDTTRPSEVAAAIRSNTKLVFIETPANPTLRLTDIQAIATIAKTAGAVLAVDNTFMTPVLQRPLELGADISVYSTTKFIEGHSSALGGALTSRDAALLDRIRFIRKCTGSIQSPFNSWLTTRGIKTLPLRIREHSRHAQILAEWLSTHEQIATVYYPGLPNFEQKAIAARQHLGGHGGVVTFELKGGLEAGRVVMNNVHLCRLCEHIGGIESLVTHPASMTHGDVPVEQRERVGITDGLIRLSVGLEDPSDIIADLERAFALAKHAVGVEGGAVCRAN